MLTPDAPETPVPTVKRLLTNPAAPRRFFLGSADWAGALTVSAMAVGGGGEAGGGGGLGVDMHMVLFGG